MARLTDRHGGRPALVAAGLLGVAALALGACEDTRKVLGVDKAPPDEFRVVSRAPLTLPPDFSLRPPAPGSVRPQEGSTRDQARQSVLDAAGTRRLAPQVPAGASPGEAALVGRVNAGRIDPDIRQAVDREASQLADSGDGYLLDAVVFWRKNEQGTVVNAPLEAQRLRENAALGRPAGDGDTPIIQRRQSRGILEGIF